MNRYVYILPIVALGCGYRILADFRLKSQIRALLHARPQLVDEEFGIRYFAGEQVPIAVETRRLLGRHLPLRLSGLHPSDSFVEDLHINAFRRTAMIEFLMDVEDYFDVELDPRQVRGIRTVSDLVKTIARHLRPPNS